MSILTEATVLTTLDCNLRCEYCFFKSIKNKEYMKPCVAKTTADFLRDHLESNNSTLNFFGGEPLLNFNVIKIITKELENMNLNIGITTNGMLASQSVIDFLLSSKINVLLSYDGPFKNKRNGVSEKQILKLLPLEPTIAMQVHPENVYFLTQNVIHIAKLGFKTLALNIVVDSYKSWDSKDITAFEKGVEKILQLPITLTFKENFSHYTCQPFSKLFRDKVMCGAANEKSIAIAPDGILYPCHRLLLPELKAGTIRDGIDFTILKKLKRFEKCNNCSVEPCAPCYAVNFSAENNFLKIPKIYCSNQKIMFNSISALNQF